ncbi:glycerate kinase [Sulfurimonas sp.]|uniref:glycerate kinase n=1 Tax=Sulfurimonas sp. TaxID=2022749 RepID=UPI0025F7BDD0|nr:glycerate kinase [Sulfurimonas sp.]
MKVVIAIDSFKGSVSSSELSSSIKDGIREIYEDSEIIICPIADGGEGTLEAMSADSDAKDIFVKCKDPLNKDIEASYIILNNSTAVIEMAAASGLPLINEKDRNPYYTTTYGTGELIRDAINKGIREFIIGLGGSATNDAGLGMLRALGFKFLDSLDAEVVYAKDLSSIAKLDISNVLEELSECSFKVACDVNNPLYGKNGASYIYSKQKGADAEMIEKLDSELKAFADFVKKEVKEDFSSIVGAGAGGGIGFGFLAFLNAELKSGIKIVLEHIKFEEKIKDAHFVITGEGKIDKQSVMGKVIDGISEHCQSQNIPCIALTGNYAEIDDEVHQKGVSAVFSILDSPMSLQDAMQKQTALKLIKNKTKQVFRLIKATRNN